MYVATIRLKLTPSGDLCLRRALFVKFEEICDYEAYTRDKNANTPFPVSITTLKNRARELNICCYFSIAINTLILAENLQLRNYISK